MPARNSIKQYVENSFYHLYNRGVEKKEIFIDEQDYSVFLSYIKDYLLPKDISLVAYCLMPNHFHFLIKQKKFDTIDLLMNSLGTRYTMFFNKKYKRVGPLYQGVYKAVFISTDEQLLQLSRYIHIQALTGQNDYQNSYCSYSEYLGKRKTAWIRPQEILTYFSKNNPLLSYKTFLESTDNDFSLISKQIIED